MGDGRAADRPQADPAPRPHAEGHRPIAPVQHRYEWRYLVGFVHPASGRTLFHLATRVTIPLFEAELAAFARQAGAGPKKKIVLVLGPGGGTPVRACGCPTMSSPLSPALFPRAPARRTPLAAHQRAALNRHFASIDELEEAQAQHCVALQAQPALVRSTTLFHWWPQRLHKRQAPKRK